MVNINLEGTKGSFIQHEEPVIQVVKGGHIHLCYIPLHFHRFDIIYLGMNQCRHISIQYQLAHISTFYGNKESNFLV